MAEADWSETTITTEGLCSLFGIVKSTVTAWVKDGMPKVSHNKYVLSDCIKWRVGKALAAGSGGDGDMNEERRRLIVEQRRGQEIDNSVKLGELLPADEVQTLMQAATGVFASQLDALPARIAPRAAVMNDPKVIERMIADECRAARSAASQAFSSQADSYADGGDDEAATEEKRGGVGGRKPHTADRLAGAGAMAD